MLPLFVAKPARNFLQKAYGSDSGTGVGDAAATNGDSSACAGADCGLLVDWRFVDVRM
jgi:hypothetical protein